MKGVREAERDGPLTVPSRRGPGLQPTSHVDPDRRLLRVDLVSRRWSPSTPRSPNRGRHIGHPHTAELDARGLIASGATTQTFETVIAALSSHRDGASINAPAKASGSTTGLRSGSWRVRQIPWSRALQPSSTPRPCGVPWMYDGSAGACMRRTKTPVPCARRRLRRVDGVNTFRVSAGRFAYFHVVSRRQIQCFRSSEPFL